MRDLTRTKECFEIASKVIAGGISSDARRAPGGTPLFIDHAEGSHLWDVDDNRYIDYILGQGPQLFGHTHPRVVEAVTQQMTRGQVYSAQHEMEAEVAQLLCDRIPCAELVRFNSVGSEAVHGAWRLARGVTGRAKILKFEGHYHGWFDPELVSVRPSPEEAGPPERPNKVLASTGQDPAAAENLVIAPWNDAESFTRILDEHDGEIAGVVMEPWMCNNGCIEPDRNFLEVVRSRTRRDGIVLIFDEVITGFRLAAGGAQELLGVTPDVAVFGKAMAGGLPLACIAGSEEVMGAIARGDVRHAGTFNSNPVVMAAAKAVLSMIAEERETLYEDLRARGRVLMDGIASAAYEHGVELLVEGPGPLFQTYFTDRREIRNYRDLFAVDDERARRFHNALLDEGVNIVGRGLWFLSSAHDEEDVEQTLLAVDTVLSSLE